MKRDAKIFLSCGFGVQSSTLLAMSCFGDLPKPEAAIFCDTGGESKATYKFKEELSTLAWRHGVKVFTLFSTFILRDGISNGSKVLLPPLHFKKNGKKQRLPHRCSNILKFRPFVAAVRERLGYTRRKWVREKVIQWVGISWDERHRRQRQRLPWLRNVYPLIDRRMTRDDCIEYLRRHGVREPPRSSCIICPLKPNRDWHRMKVESPEDWESACDYDDMIRTACQGKYHPLYVHGSCVPLRDADLSRSWATKRRHHGT